MADWLTEELGSLCTKTFVVQCARVKDFCCAVCAIPQRLSFVVVLPYKNFCWLMYARHYGIGLKLSKYRVSNFVIQIPISSIEFSYAETSKYIR